MFFGVGDRYGMPGRRSFLFGLFGIRIIKNFGTDLLRKSLHASSSPLVTRTLNQLWLKSINNVGRDFRPLISPCARVAPLASEIRSFWNRLREGEGSGWVGKHHLAIFGNARKCRSMRGLSQSILIYMALTCERRFGKVFCSTTIATQTHRLILKLGDASCFWPRRDTVKPLGTFLCVFHLLLPFVNSSEYMELPQTCTHTHSRPFSGCEKKCFDSIADLFPYTTKARLRHRLMLSNRLSRIYPNVRLGISLR